MTADILLKYSWVNVQRNSKEAKVEHMLSINHNMQAWNAQRQFNITTNAKVKKTEKLSSGYRINRAADDAAGLAISEKMRRQIRGLMAGTENAQHGVSWVQIGEGALNEAHDILHRMNELTLKAQNGTYTAVDREYMEEEFNHLQSELDRISTTTTFNGLNIFRDHEPTYDQICGNIKWEHEETHQIMTGRNQLIINYRDTLDSEQKTITLEVASGSYTTHELIDELDDAASLLGSPIRMEYNEQGICSLNLENGEIIDTISGDLQYLLWDTYNGGGYGALIGTTAFLQETDELEIVQGQNDHMEFIIEYFDGSGTDTVSMDLDTGWYTKKELMDIIDQKILEKAPNSGLRTDHHGDAIMLSSDIGVVTGFKGNMFKIENEDPIYTSVFYDNIQHGYVWQDPASVVGGAVLTTDTRDKEHNRYYIDSSNNKLVLQPNQRTSPTTITIDTNTTNGYTAAQMVEQLNNKFAAAGLAGEVKAYLVRSKTREEFPDGTDPSSGAAVKESVGDDSVYFEGVEIRTVKEGPDSIVNIDKDASTAYDTLFTIKNFNSYGGTATDAKVDNETRTDSNAYAESSKVYGSSDKVTIKNNVNDRFTITLSSKAANGTTGDYNKSFTIDILDSGSKTMTAAQLASAINTAIGKNSELKDRIEAKYDSASGKIRILDKEDKTLDNVDDDYLNWNTEIELSSAGGNSGYRTIFQQSYTYDVQQTKSGKGSLELTVPTSGVGSGMTININGTNYWFSFNGATSASGIKAAIDKATPVEFKEVTGTGTTKPQNFTVNGNGTTSYIYWAGGTATGDSTKKQGVAGYEKNAPAELAIGPALPTTKMKVTSDNNKITLALNGKKETVTLADGEYDQDGLVDALQDAIDAAFGTGMGGALVDVKNNQLVITSRLPSNEDGKKTSITAYAQGAATNTFFDSLNRVETAASCTSEQKLLSNITLSDGISDKFKFSFTDSTGTYNVELDLTDNAGGETFNTAQKLVDRINSKLSETGTPYAGKVKASLDGGYLTLTTTEKGNKTRISYTTGPSTATDPNAKAIFGDLATAVTTTAKIVLDKNVKASADFTGTKTFKFDLDGVAQEVQIGKWTTANGLAANLNNAFQANGIAVTASIVDGKLNLTKNVAGSGSLHMKYATGGTVMADIFGYEPKPGVTVSVNGNKLTIKGGANDVITVDSATSGGLLEPKKATGYLSHNEGTGFHSAKFSTVTSTTLDSNGVALDRWNNDLQFTFKQGTKTSNVNITLAGKPDANGVTSLNDIRDELQTKIDAALGKDVIEVLLDNNKLTLKSKKAGSEFQFSGMQSNAAGKTGGGFFHHVMCGYTKKENQLADPADVNGEQYADDIFAQGRHDVVTELTKLKPGISDTLILDLTYIPDTDHDRQIETDKQQTITLELKLDPNMREEDFYNADKLKKMIQEKLNEAINSTEVQQKANQLGIQLHENFIEVDVGRHQTDVWGNKDNVAISFTMTKDPDIATPVEGYFYIDGIRGNAAYETFYHTEGELIPAYIIGTKNVNNGVVLGKDDTELSFMVDDEEFTLTLDPGKYTAEELVDTITQQFKDQNIPLAAEITRKGYLKISHQRMGKHVIEKVTGSARDELFFLEHEGKNSYQERYVRLSSSEGDRIELYSPRFSTMMLNINSICISDIKYAEKATNRIKDAINAVSEMRSTFGAIQNRLEHAINNNQNKEENLQTAESRIRDADIAKEMVDFANLSIIQQTGQAVLAQANQSRNYVLSLLS